MKLSKLRIKNYKKFEDILIELNENVNIFVGENDSGKTTILEAISMVLTGKINERSLINKFNLDWFNISIRKAYIKAIEENEQAMLPKIEIEAYFNLTDSDDMVFRRFKGTNNSLREDIEGVKLIVEFDTDYSEIYKQLLNENKIKDIPIEYYKISFASFNQKENYVHFTSRKVACIDTTKKDYGIVLNRFVSNSINEYLTDEEVTELHHAYRENRVNFTNNPAVKKLNEKLQESHDFEGKSITLNLKENRADEWKDDMRVSLEEIPLEQVGFGTQNMFKTEMFLLQNSTIDILTIEEPENNLSYSNMAILIKKLDENRNKQLFISTHSNYVANKLGLKYLHLVADGKVRKFTNLSDDTYNYFVKLPGYNTLRVLLANKVILVEGPADEMIVQRAYLDRYNKLPIEDGVDVIAVDGLAFKRYCDIAKIISKKIIIVTDNDGDLHTVENKYLEYKDLIKLCVESDENLNTLEPSVLAVNEDDFETFRAIVYHGNDISNRNRDSILEYMTKNKTEWSMRVFNSTKKIRYPDYILKAINFDEHVGTPNE